MFQFKPKSLAFSLCFLLVSASFTPLMAEVLYETDSQYYHIKVTQEGDYRYLAFDRTRGNQSVYNVRNPDEMKFPYTCAMFLGLAFLDNPPKRALFIGLGGGTMPRIMSKYMPDTLIDTVEIDPYVVKVARDYFDFTPSTKMKVFVQDGRQYLRRSAHTYDIIFLDAYNSKSIPFHLSTQEFFNIVKKRLNPKGVVVSNVWSPSSNQYHYSHIKTLQNAFPQLYSFIASGSGNYVFVSPAHNKQIDEEDLQRRVDELLQKTLLPISFDSFMSSFEDLTGDEVDAIVLTDDYAPVDTLRSERAKP